MSSYYTNNYSVTTETWFHQLSHAFSSTFIDKRSCFFSTVSAASTYNHSILWVQNRPNYALHPSAAMMSQLFK